MPLPNTRPDFDIDARPHIFRSPSEWASFWHSLAPWFERRGYRLHTPGSKTSLGLSDAFTVPVLETSNTEQHHSPFAYTDKSAEPEFIYDSHPLHSTKTIGQSHAPMHRTQAKSLVPVRVPPFIATSNTGRAYAAQDSLGRHVYLKILKRDSEQFRVVELLRQQTQTPGVLPILDVLEYDEDYAFLVMPRWADILGPSLLLRSVGDVGEFVVDILKGLDTLHSLRIAHRDIKINNMVMNHLFPLPVRALRPMQHLGIHSSQGTSKLITGSRETIIHRLEFAIIDFDFAMIIPTSKSGKDRLPSTLAWMQEYSALDVAQGELVYDPFQYDVGVLGVMFCEMLQKYTPVIPNLAPLLDRMTTHELTKRFTARQAYTFAVKYLLQELREKQIQQSLMVSSYQSSPLANLSSRTTLLNTPWSSYDRWANLPPSFFSEFPQWSKYVTPPLPRWKAWLRQVCKTEEGRRRVGKIRKALAVVGIGEGSVRY